MWSSFKAFVGTRIKFVLYYLSMTTLIALGFTLIALMTLGFVLYYRAPTSQTINLMAWFGAGAIVFAAWLSFRWSANNRPQKKSTRHNLSDDIDDDVDK